MSQIIQAAVNNVSVDRRLLASGQKAVLSTREASKLQASAFGTDIIDLGPGVLFSSLVTLSGVTANGQVVATLTPGFSGRVVSTFAVVAGAVSTASKAATLTPAIRLDPTVAATQTLALTGGPTGGTFTLTFKGQTTSGINYNANAAAVQSALEGLSNIHPGDVSVSGTSLPTGPLTITFGGSLAGEQPALTGNPASLSGGSDEDVVITVTSAGSGEAAVAIEGGVIALTSANATPSGKVVPGSRVVDLAADGPNRFDADSSITFTASGVTAFSEGTVLIGVLVAPDRKPGPAEI